MTCASPPSRQSCPGCRQSQSHRVVKRHRLVYSHLDFAVINFRAGRDQRNSAACIAVQHGAIFGSSHEPMPGYSPMGRRPMLSYSLQVEENYRQTSGKSSSPTLPWPHNHPSSPVYGKHFADSPTRSSRKSLVLSLSLLLS